jgi:hypothetical protein
VADAISALTDPESVIAARAEVEAAETISKPEIIAAEAVFRPFIVRLLRTRLIWGQIIRCGKDAAGYKLNCDIPCDGAEVTAH